MSEDQRPPEDLEPTRTQDREANSTAGEDSATRSLNDNATPSVNEASPKAPPIAPVSIGDYVLLSKLGQGGMGVVYEAEQQHPHRKVALKVVRGGQFVDEHRVRLFQREADTLARLKHPNIGAIYESGCTEDGQHYFVMELVDGETLQDYLKRRPKILSPRELRHSLALFRKIVDAVHYAHQRGVIHRDLKPSNIFVTEEATPEDSASSASSALPGPRVPEIKILDFGLARITASDVTATTMTTEVGVIKGTLSYMSPEQARGNPNEIEVRSDVYALGVILYEMLTGSRPYDVSKKSLAEALRVICEEPPQSLRKTLSGAGKIDSDVETIVAKALDKEVDRRYASAATLSEDISRFLTSQPILARPPSTIYQLRKFASRNRALVGGVVATILVLVAGIIISTVFGLREAAQRQRAEAGVLFALGRLQLETNPTAAIAYALASLERIDDPDVRRFAIEALWEGPTYSVPDGGQPGRVVHGVDISPDGRWLAAGEWTTGDVKLWSEAGGFPQVLSGHDGNVAFVRFGENSRILASADYTLEGPNSIYVRSVPEGETLRRIVSPHAHADSVLTPLALKQNDLITQMLIPGPAFERAIQIWPVRGGEPVELGRVRGCGDEFLIAINPHRRHVACSDGRKVFLVNLEDHGAARPRLLGRHDADVYNLCFDSTGKRVVSGDKVGGIRIWAVDPQTNGPLRVLQAQDGVYRVRVEEDGSRLAATHFNGTVSVWDLDGPPAADPVRLRGLELQALDAAFHPDGRWLAATDSQKVSLWRLARVYPRILRGHTERIRGVVFGPGGRWVASSSWDGTVREWRLQPEIGLPASTILDTLRPTNFQGLAGDPLGRWLLTVSDLAQLIAVEDGQPRELHGLNNSGGAVIWGMTFSPDGRYAAVGGGYFQKSNAVVRVWDVESGDLRIFDPGDGQMITDLAITSNGQLISAGKGGLRAWDLEDGESRLLRDQPVWVFELSPDERTAVAVDWLDPEAAAGGRAMLLDLDGAEIATLESHGESVHDVSFDSTGTIVITGDADGILRVGPVDGSKPHLLLGHQGVIWTVDVSPDNQWIASGGDDSDLRLWPMPEGRPFHTLPYREFTERLRSLTNIRVVEDQDSPSGYRLEADPFPGWATAPTW